MLDKDYIYMIGIGGIGMSALARYFKSIGKNVAGYDRVRSPLCELLEKEGISIHYEDNLDLIDKEYKDKRKAAVIYTPAIKEEHLELEYYKKKEMELHKRADVLGIISKNYTCLAVAGTHGKTTTSALLAHIFRQAQKKALAFLGGIAVNYQSNFLPAEDCDIMVVEADEFDRSFLTLKTSGAIITSTDADHLDIYGDADSLEKTFVKFGKRVTNHLIVKNGLPIDGLKYDLEADADFKAVNIRIEKHSYTFDLVTDRGSISNISSGLPGRHNVENALAAAALALQYGLSLEEVKSGIETFAGVKRRFEYHIKTEKQVYIDDYAHHPTEIQALIQSVRELYPESKITGIFQPHLYTRTQDFADGFAESLSSLDDIIVMPIYPARERPIAGVTSNMLLEKIDHENKKLLSEQEILNYVNQNPPEVILTIGAGDIDRIVNPLKMALLNG